MHDPQRVESVDVEPSIQRADYKVFLFIFHWRIIALQYCWFPPLYQCESAIGIQMSPPSWTSLPPPFPSNPCRLSHSLGFELSHTADSHWLFILYLVMYMLQCCSLNSLNSQPLIPPLLHKPVLYVCVSTVALQIGLSIPSFQIPYIWVNMPYLLFWLCKVIHGFSNAQSGLLTPTLLKGHLYSALGIISNLEMI